jgi:hypothetical protein
MFRPRIINAKAAWDSEPNQAESQVFSLLLFLKKRHGSRPLMKEKLPDEGHLRCMAQSYSNGQQSLRLTPRKRNVNDIATKRDRFTVSPHTIAIAPIRPTKRAINIRRETPHRFELDAASVGNLSKRAKIPTRLPQEETAEPFEKPKSPRKRQLAVQVLLQDVLFHWSTAILCGAKVLLSAAFLCYTRLAMSVSIVVIVGLVYRNYLSYDTNPMSCPSQIPNIIFVSKPHHNDTDRSTAPLVSDDISLISETTTDNLHVHFKNT